MKKVALALVLVASGAIAFGQTQKGDFTLSLHNFSPHISGGLLGATNGLGFSTGHSVSETDGEKTEYSYTTIGFNCAAEYFIANNLSIGPNVSLLFQTLKAKASGEVAYKTNTSMGGVELHYYFDAWANSKCWVSGLSSWGSSQININGNEDQNPAKITYNALSAGISYFPMKRFSIDLGLGYGTFHSKDQSKNTQGYTTEYSNTRSGMTADIGFSVFF